jgi:hypothetical protein
MLGAYQIIGPLSATIRTEHLVLSNTWEWPGNRRAFIRADARHEERTAAPWHLSSFYGQTKPVQAM